VSRCSRDRLPECLPRKPDSGPASRCDPIVTSPAASASALTLVAGVVRGIGRLVAFGGIVLPALAPGLGAGSLSALVNRVDVVHVVVRVVVRGRGSAPVGDGDRITSVCVPARRRVASLWSMPEDSQGELRPESDESPVVEGRASPWSGHGPGPRAGTGGGWAAGCRLGTQLGVSLRLLLYKPPRIGWVAAAPYRRYKRVLTIGGHVWWWLSRASRDLLGWVGQ